jgi:hypothetical protein
MENAADRVGVLRSPYGGIISFTGPFVNALDRRTGMCQRILLPKRWAVWHVDWRQEAAGLSRVRSFSCVGSVVVRLEPHPPI